MRIFLQINAEEDVHHEAAFSSSAAPEELPPSLSSLSSSTFSLQMRKKMQNRWLCLLALLVVLHLLLAGEGLALAAGSGGGDAAAMAELAKSLANAPVDWRAGSDPCSPKWTGVSCSGGRVSGINLRGLGLSGNLPSAISSLGGLKSLFLPGNRLTGTLPSLGGLEVLQEISVDDNLFSSIPPDFFSGLSGLHSVSIDGNPLSPWQLPDSLADCPLTSFSASNASVSGSLPDFFDRLSSLQSLRLSYNNLTGPLPTSLARSPIRDLILNNQRGPKLSGRIDVVGQMNQLSLLWIQSNSFSGPIPDLSNLTSLQSFNARDNALTGIVPNSLTAATTLQNVTLSNNLLQGPMPVFGRNVAADIQEGNSFCLQKPGNCDSKVMQLLAVAAGFGYPIILADPWKGDDPCTGRGWFGVICDQQGNIVTLNFANQHLQGFIAPEIANITTLTKVILNNNSLTGMIPDSLTNLHQLQLLDVSYNQLTGDIPNFATTVKLLKAGNNFGSGTSGSDSRFSSPSSGAQNGNPKSSVALTVGMVVLAVVLLACSAGIAYYIRRHRGMKREQIISVLTETNPFRPELVKPEFVGMNGNGIAGGENSDNIISIQDLRSATRNFSEDNVLGRGGFGVVYKGELNGMEVAVKRCVLDMMSLKGVSEFKAEIGLIGKARHKNLVSLVGYCEHENERLLVYEYMPEGTLAQHLFDRERGRYSPLNWKQRLTIALDVAKAMEYLHSFMQGSFIHRDLKPSNILLDKDLRGKVSDFGLIKLAGDTEKSMATRLAGTFGYLAPEYAITGKITRKIDVYAFGVILLELMTSRKVLDDSVPDEDANLVAAFRRIYPRNATNLDRFVDSSLFPDDESRSTMADVAEIAYHCAAREPNRRPEMSNVVAMLSPVGDRWCPSSTYDDHDADGDSSLKLSSMVKKWQMSSEESSVKDSFSAYNASNSALR
ncbi:putative receptor protein kinase TMK1 [Apostasia shenzhenica]|uniref:Putative receptor protein kinase TMK1 n=1 Tax=Apostasia shenzhenica TaxID=1088818 RepID=A0A2I0A292_9ASPA|nr:putative receptor protein kinase TMK1 [Apostasia shenzhenica]